MLIRVVDFETTGLGDDAEPVEVGWTDVMDGKVGLTRSVFVALDFPVVIEPEARAVHHIDPNDVMAYGVSLDRMNQHLREGTPDLLASHYAEFDQRFYNPPAGTVWVCTEKCARAAWEHAPSYGNQTLRYWLNLLEVCPMRATPSHRAGPDTYVTAFLLLALLNRFSLDQLIEWTKAPRVFWKMPFGKHRGKRFDDLPYDYLEWILSPKASDMDPEIRLAARRAMNKMEGHLPFV